MAEKMTQKQMYAFIAEQMADHAEVVEFCEKKIEQLSKERKPRKTAEDVIARREAALAVLKDADGPIAGSVIAEAAGMTKGQATAAVRYLVEHGMAVKFAGEKSKDPMTYAIAE